MAEYRLVVCLQVDCLQFDFRLGLLGLHFLYPFVDNELGSWFGKVQTLVYRRIMDLQSLVQDLKIKGWHMSESLVPADLCDDLLSQLLLHKQTSQLNKAQIGQGVETQIQKEIRGDFIRWIDFAKIAPCEKKFIDWLDLFLQKLRPELLLGLSQFEFHYAFYPPQTHYEKHIDVFKKNSSRQISFVLYLNKNWAPTDGGEIVLFDEKDPSRESQRFAPHFGHLVLFLSDTIYHQVTFTNRERFSVTGWLKNRF